MTVPCVAANDGKLAAYFFKTPLRPKSVTPPASSSLSSTQVRFFLLQNRQGKTRLSKWYVAIEEADKRKIENEVHRLITSRDSKFTNFVSARTQPQLQAPRWPAVLAH